MIRTRSFFPVLLPALLYFSATGTALAQQQTVGGPPLAVDYESAMISAPPSALGLDTFYTKHIDAYGIPVVSSGNVPNTALLYARDIINYMLLKRPDVRKSLISNHARLSILGKNEMQTDLPECRDWKKPTFEDKRLTDKERAEYHLPGGVGSMTDKGYWNQRARGMGGIQTSCAEENLLGYPGTKYYGENIAVHEFSHNIMGALKKCDPAFYAKIEAAYLSAKSKGMYKGQYAINTKDEYWAEGTQWWFYSNYEFFDGKMHLRSPEDLKKYDPELYALLDQIYPGHHIPTDVYYGKNIPYPATRK
ncbi:glycoside hydrolase [Pedobacter sp. AW31-3R]|uniref:glycoside hydrolase n=1 Tax=Pedobacter sp. AW31-3R TaxID=3445781 RepID=UPI003FA15F0C